MTTIGKILVVLHLVMSIMFMAFAGAVFTAQNNWKTAEKAAQAKLVTADTNNRNLMGEAEKLRTELAQEKAGMTKDIEMLKGLRQGLETENKTLVSDNRQLRKEVDQLRDQAALAVTETTERKKEADLQREKNSDIYAAREVQEAKQTELQDRVFALDIQLQQISEKYELALNENKTMKAFLSSKELTTDPKQMVALTTPPPPLNGRVLEVLKADKGRGRELVEVSLGRDSGLEVGHTLTAYRENKYLGLIRITRVEADKAVGFVLQKAKNAEFHVADEVTTKY